MSELLELTGPNHKLMVKEAVLGAAAGFVAKKIITKPLPAIGHAFNAMGVVEGSAKINDQSGVGRDLGAFATKTKQSQTM